jgi:hypothetical protein
VNRYKSIVAEEEPYQLECIRYLHLNRLRARVVPDLPALARYPWSGHSALLGRVPRPWQTVAALRRGRESYVADARILGSSPLVESLRAEAERAERQRLRLRARRPDLPTLLPKVARAVGLAPEALQGAGAAARWPGPVRVSRISSSRSSGTAAATWRGCARRTPCPCTVRLAGGAPSDRSGTGSSGT